MQGPLGTSEALVEKVASHADQTKNTLSNICHRAGRYSTNDNTLVYMLVVLLIFIFMYIYSY